jgi:peptidoglycan/LPS O-acetylase OafA/YrhL
MSPSPTGLRFHLGHRPALDGLRGIAILSVLGSHVSPSIVVGGGAGVDLFFVLSGFLITCLLVAEWDRNERISLSKFYARRALRLFPALFVYLVGCYVLAAIFQQGAPREATQKGVFYALFYVANWARVNHVSLGLAETTWSLSIEEQFYIFWPLLLILGLKYLSRRTLVKVVLALVAVVTLHRLGLAMRGADYARVYNGSDTRADGLLMGCALAMFVSWRGVPRGRWVQVVGALSGLFFLAYVARNTTYTAWSVASTSSLLALSRPRAIRSCGCSRCPRSSGWAAFPTASTSGTSSP